MNFKKSLKMMLMTSIVVVTLLMVIVSPALGFTSPVGMKRVPVEDLKVKPNVIGPIVDEPDVIDTTIPPQTYMRDFDGWLNTDAKIDLRVRDFSGTGTKTYFAYFNVNNYPNMNLLLYEEGTSFTISKPGEYKLLYYSIDNLGNVEELKANGVKIDKYAPVTKFHKPELMNKEKFTVEFDGRDDLSGIKEFKYSLDDGKSYTSANSVSFTKEGTYKVLVYAVDNAGNEGNVVEFTTTLDLPSSNNGGNDDDGDYYVEYNTFKPTEYQIKIGYSVLMEEDDRIEFTLNEKDYVLKLNELSTKAKFDFVDDLVFDERQSKTFDLSGNEIVDFKIIVGSIENDKVLVTIKSIQEFVGSNTEEDEEEGNIVVNEIPLVDNAIDSVQEDFQEVEETNWIRIGLLSVIVLLFATIIGVVILHK
ncbi:MAG: hypothetical protein AB7V77_03505 [Candidatus Woesearchaeota archaeon]